MLKRSDRRPPDAQRDPEWTKARLLDAAFQEFSEKGLGGARVNTIAERAGVNKQLVYYYFGDKERLYAAVLKRTYTDIRIGEQGLDLDAMPPLDAMRSFIEFTFDYLVEHGNFVALLNDENLHKARHVRGSRELRALHTKLGKTIGGTLKRGRAEGTFKRDVDAVDLYISIASLCYFYHSNNYTLSAIFGRDLARPDQVRRRRRHIVELVLTFLTTPDGAGFAAT